jgi:hypothetical protein
VKENATEVEKLQKEIKDEKDKPTKDEEKIKRLEAKEKSLVASMNDFKTRDILAYDFPDETPTKIRRVEKLEVIIDGEKIEVSRDGKLSKAGAPLGEFEMKSRVQAELGKDPNFGNKTPEEQGRLIEERVAQYKDIHNIPIDGVETKKQFSDPLDSKSIHREVNQGIADRKTSMQDAQRARMGEAKVAKKGGSKGGILMGLLIMAAGAAVGVAGSGVMGLDIQCGAGAFSPNISGQMETQLYHQGQAVRDARAALETLQDDALSAE